MDNQKFYDFILSNYDINKTEYDKIKLINPDLNINELFDIYFSLIKKENIDIKNIINILTK